MYETKKKNGMIRDPTAKWQAQAQHHVVLASFSHPLKAVKPINLFLETFL